MFYCFFPCQSFVLLHFLNTLFSLSSFSSSFSLLPSSLTTPVLFFSFLHLIILLSVFSLFLLKSYFSSFLSYIFLLFLDQFCATTYFRYVLTHTFVYTLPVLPSADKFIFLPISLGSAPVLPNDVL